MARRMNYDRLRMRDLVRERGGDYYCDDLRPARDYLPGPQVPEVAEAMAYVKGYTGRNRFIKDLQRRRRNSRYKQRWRLTEAQATTVLSIKGEEVERCSAQPIRG